MQKNTLWPCSILCVMDKCERKCNAEGHKKNAVYNFGVTYVILLIVGCRDVK